MMDAEIIVPSNVVAQIASGLLGVVLGILCVGQIAVPECLEGDGAVCQVCGAQGLVHKLELRSGIFYGREIAVQLVYPADAEERGVGDRTPFLSFSKAASDE